MLSQPLSSEHRPLSSANTIDHGQIQKVAPRQIVQQTKGFSQVAKLRQIKNEGMTKEVISRSQANLVPPERRQEQHQSNEFSSPSIKTKQSKMLVQEGGSAL